MRRLCVCLRGRHGAVLLLQATGINMIMEVRMKSRSRRSILLLAAVLCAGVLLAGCGEDRSVHTGAEAQTKDMAETSEDTAEETAEDTADKRGEMGLPEQTSASRAQMEIDDETRRELTKQLLEEENLDTSVMESGRVTKGCTFDLPEGFEESEDADNMYVTKRYPIDASTISYIEMEEDISQQLLTEETFKEQTEESLKQIYDEDVALVVDAFEHIRISGYPAFRILCHYTVGGVEMTQLEYAINADRSYMVIYSQTSDYDYMETYEASAETIRVN